MDARHDTGGAAPRQDTQYPQPHFLTPLRSARNDKRKAASLGTTRKRLLRFQGTGSRGGRPALAWTCFISGKKTCLRKRKHGTRNLYLGFSCLPAAAWRWLTPWRGHFGLVFPTPTCKGRTRSPRSTPWPSRSVGSRPIGHRQLADNELPHRCSTGAYGYPNSPAGSTGVLGGEPRESVMVNLAWTGVAGGQPRWPGAPRRAVTPTGSMGQKGTPADKEMRETGWRTATDSGAGCCLVL
jgi:hypothetical protein